MKRVGTQKPSLKRDANEAELSKARAVIKCLANSGQPECARLASEYFIDAARKETKCQK